ncbi:uncharacterized protein LOC111830938 [Capsella rubella]|uniref:uncharacterized protein LOC111830938 n=1 Tax=Capsella rubella TaxID=81985 RepID=UPI000CD4E7E7|nr:uncharacterized protein LOC111830938 [Capsella rubella]
MGSQLPPVNLPIPPNPPAPVNRNPDPPRFQTDQYENPFYLNSNDHAGLLLVSDRLTTASDFHSWKRSIWMALNVRNKLGFVNGEIPKPPDNHPDSGTWSRCNDIVSTWLLNSVDKSIGKSLLYISTAEGMWKSLMTRFKQDDAPRIFDIEQRLNKIEQGSLDVSAYYTALISLWEEYKNYVELPVCTCGHCECDAAVKWEKLQQRSRVTKFLMGLNEGYDQIRRHILMLKPIPSIEEAFHMVTQDERQRTIKPTSRIDNVAFQTNQTPMVYEDENAYIAAYNTVRPAQKPVCTHCGKLGHTVHKCFKLHGYPPGYKTGGYNPRGATSQPPVQPRMPAPQLQPRIPQMQPRMQMQMVPYDAVQRANAVANVYAEQSSYAPIGYNQYAAPLYPSPQYIPAAASSSGLHDGTTQQQEYQPQQIQQLISQFNTQVQVPEPVATSKTATVTEQGFMANNSTSGIISFPTSSLTFQNDKFYFKDHALSALEQFLPSDAWIIDSGASSHVCSDLAMFRELVPVSSITVTLPNGARELSQGLMIGRGSLYNNLYILAQEQNTLSPSLPAVCSVSESLMTDGVLWHQRLGHPSAQCQICPLAKQKRLAYISHNNLASVPFELVHLDIWGPFSVESIEVSTQYNAKIKAIRSDNAPELAFTELVKEHGMVHHFSCPYTPQQNSVVTFTIVKP